MILYDDSFQQQVTRAESIFNLKYDRFATTEKLFGRHLPMEVKEQIRTIRRVLYETHGENWDMQIELEPVTSKHYNEYGDIDFSYRRFDKFKISKIFFIIRYPELEIKNSLQAKHIIKDMFIRFEVEVQDKSLFFHKMTGMRMSFTEDEYSTGYAHSHQQTINIKTEPSFRAFCTGTGQTIDTTVASLNALDVIDEDLFRLYLYAIENYLKWESLEGIPYKKIAYIHGLQEGLPNLSGNTKEIIKNEIVEAIKEGKIKPNFNWIYKPSSGVYHLIANDKADDHFTKSNLKEINSNNLIWDRSGVFVYKDDNGKYYNFKKPERINLSNYYRDFSLLFRGQKIFITLLPNPEEEEFGPQTEPENLHPEIVSHILNELEHATNQQKIEISISRRITNSRSIRYGFEPNQIPV